MTTNTTNFTRDETARTSAHSRGAGSAAGSETFREAGRSARDHARRLLPARTERGPVVLLLDHRNASSIAIRRAAAMSDGLEAKLHVVLSIPEATASRHPALVARNVADLLSASAPRRGYELEVVKGSIVELGAEIARDEDAALVVVGPRFGAKEACRLADELGVSVLVARDARRGGDWIAASDMLHLTYPVLSTARELSRALERDLLFFHNARPVPVFVGDPMVGAATYAGMLALQDDAAAAKRSRLQHLAATEGRLDSIVGRGASTVDAVLDLARTRDADLVAVGHHRRSWLERLLGRGTAEKIVERSRRSVLIVPLER